MSCNCCCSCGCPKRPNFSLECTPSRYAPICVPHSSLIPPVPLPPVNLSATNPAVLTLANLPRALVSGVVLGDGVVLNLPTINDIGAAIGVGNSRCIRAVVGNFASVTFAPSTGTATPVAPLGPGGTQICFFVESYTAPDYTVQYSIS